MAKEKNPKSAELVVKALISFPNLTKPDKFGRFRVDCLFTLDDKQPGIIRKAIKKVGAAAFGEDREEWPKKARKKFVREGNEREDQPTYKDKLYISANSNNPPACIDLAGKNINPALVRAGMEAKVSINVTAWENEKFGEGISIYLQGIMLDPTQQPQPGFGGAKNGKQLFKDHLEAEDSESDEDDEGEDNEDEEEDQPPKKKKKKRPVDEDEDEEEDEESDDDESDEDDED